MKAPSKVVFDCEKMKYPNTGIYYFCQYLGSALQTAHNPEQEEIQFYTPHNCRSPFGESVNYLRQQSWHKYYNLASYRSDVWHSNYQLSKYLPISSRTGMVLTVHDLNFLIDTNLEE